MLENPRFFKTSNCILYKILVGSIFFLLYKLNNTVYRVLLNKPMENPSAVRRCRLAIFDTPTQNPFQGLEELRIQL